MPWKWYQSEVIDITDVGPKTKQFTVTVEHDEVFDFLPGQFITLDLPIHDKRTKRWRSYSIANAPDGTNLLQLCIVYLNGGLASEYLFSDVKIGSKIKFKGPSGGFTLPREPRPEMVMVCTGTGIAPFRSMLQYLKKEDSFASPIHLIFGTRYEEGILYRAEMESLANDFDSFTFSVVLSRDQNWPGLKGYVHQVYEQHYPDSSSERLFYLCGWSMMVDAAVAKLIVEMGYQRSQIRYELYG